MSEQTIDCAVRCVNGCVLGDECPHQDYKNATSKFIEKTSIEDILKIAADSLEKRLTRSPEFVLPDPPAWPEG